jgi:hypothetical protein
MRDGAAELLFVGRENLDALPPARDGDIPLLRIRCSAHGGVAKENVIHGLALRAVGCDRVAPKKLPIGMRQRATVGQRDRTLI